ncbi:phospholipid N-methyltransferase [Phyllobacterium sp. P30BS-XVII]|nr:phospholipid N-methyltransferase [Phyllobacterium sp. P30BS-XVII]
MMTGSVWTFMRALLSDPFRVSAIAPSGAALARLITSEITPASGPVLELGPGTGVFTDALLARGVRPKDLTLIEYGAEFARLLQSRFPGMRILQMDAAQLDLHEFFDIQPAGAVVSGLPLLSMTQEKVAAILGGAFSNLRPEGAYYQFTYGFRCPVSKSVLDQLDLDAVCIGRAFRNIPPAAVYRIVRRGAATPVAI